MGFSFMARTKSEKNDCLAGREESLPQIFAWGGRGGGGGEGREGALTMFLVKKDRKMKYGFQG